MVQRTLEMRYVGQEHAVNVSVPIALFRNEDRTTIKLRFDAQHELRYGSSVADQPAEIVNLRTAVIGMLAPPPMERIQPAGKLQARDVRSGERSIYFSAARATLPSATYARTDLRAGHVIEGPAVVEEVASTTVVPPGYVLTVDPYGNLIIEHATRRAKS